MHEHDPDPNISTRHLRVEHAGATFASFNFMLVKGMGDITEKRSSQFEDYDCDGVTIVAHQGHDGLVFSELKSKFSTQKLYEAFRQMTHSFLKMHAMLSLCKDYKVEDVSLHFIAACQCFEDKDQEDGIYNRLSKEEQEDDTTFAGLRLEDREQAIDDEDDGNEVPYIKTHRLQTRGGVRRELVSEIGQ